MNNQNFSMKLEVYLKNYCYYSNKVFVFVFYDLNDEFHYGRMERSKQRRTSCEIAARQHRITLLLRQKTWQRVLSRTCCCSLFIR